jgi:hypothetical protein
VNLPTLALLWLLPENQQETGGFNATARYAKYCRLEVATDGNPAKEPEAPQE